MKVTIERKEEKIEPREIQGINKQEVMGKQAQRERETDRQSNRQTGREVHKEIKQTDTQKQ